MKLTPDQQARLETARKALVAKYGYENQDSNWLTALDYGNAKCDYCGEKAMYDAQTLEWFWAFVCQEHFEQHTHKRLGLGWGQLLIPMDGDAQ